MTVVFGDGNVQFREVERGDLDRIRRLRNDVSTWVQLGDPAWVSPAAQEAWFASMSSAGRWVYVAEVSGQDQNFLGIVRLDEWDKINQSIRVGADVVPEMRRRGYGRAIYRALKDYCFNSLNCHRVWLCVLATNPAKSLYEKEGFKEEGRLREAIFRYGKRVDYVVMSILRDEQKKA
jgi:RimJ/RimL family protein N-acetyltransferase